MSACVGYSGYNGRSSFVMMRPVVPMDNPILHYMDETDLQLLQEQPVFRQVLELYSELILQAGEDRDEEEQGIRWAKRIVELKSVASGELSSIHGKLIALGWLTFQLEDRSAGLMYRITAEGKKACEFARLKEHKERQAGAA